METEKIKQFEELVRPAIKWLCENEHPHVKIIITPRGATLLEESMGTGLIDDYILD